MVPSVAHFIWFGRHFPWLNELAIASAALPGAFERVVLHHDGELNPAVLERLRRVPGFAAERIDPEALFNSIDGGDELRTVYAALVRPNARANVVRAAILYRHGGVYLDMDTVTLRSLAPLCVEAAFCGEERVAWPKLVRYSRHPYLHARALVQDLVRFGCAHLPRGWRLFRQIESMYPCAVNNAVIGVEPNHPFMARLLHAMLRVPEAQRTVPFALGTHLLQAQIAEWQSIEHSVTVHPPQVFYPLGPVISHQWFSKGSPDALDDLISPETYVVHWYASVRNRDHVAKIDEQYIRHHAHSELFSAMVDKYVPMDFLLAT
ncbi:MAG: hypothetical protein KTR25_20220 [Myxococcales bacterium]|nr:hypothetical protein [Myxococcales bacterium]